MSSLLSLNNETLDTTDNKVNISESNIILTQNYGINGGITDISRNMFTITNSSIHVQNTNISNLGSNNTWTGTNNFISDLSINNTNTKINSTSVVGISGGIVNVSGSTISLGSSNIVLPNIQQQKKNNVVFFDTATSALSYGTATSFSDDVSFNNAKTQINSTSVVGLSGGVVNISGGTISLGSSNIVLPNIQPQKKNNVVFFDTTSKALSYGTATSFSDDVSFNNANTQINSTSVVGLSGGTVNISGGTVNISGGNVNIKGPASFGSALSGTGWSIGGTGNATFNNASTQISSTGVVGLSGGVVNISGGVVNIGGGNAIINGNVGIGTTSPTQKLDVSGSIVLRNGGYYTTYQSHARYTSDGSNTTYLNNDKSGGNLLINTGSPNSNVIIDNGRLGIGMAIPSNTLDISGGLTITNNYGFGFGTDTQTIYLNNNSSGFGSGQTLSSKIKLLGGNQGGSIVGYNTWGSDQGLIFNTNSGSDIERMRIMSNGNVGIGTANPYFKTTIAYSGQYTSATTPNKNFGLEIYNSEASGTSNRPNLILFTDSNSTQAAIGGYRENWAGHYLGGLVFYCDNQPGDYTQPSGYTQGRPGNTTQASNSLTEMMRITPYGNVGIGTAAPGAKLDVSGGDINIRQIYAPSSSRSIVFVDNLDGGFGTMGMKYTSGPVGTEQSDTYLSLVTDNTNRLSITKAGNVGIGTTSPAYKLDVNGDSIFRSKMYFADTAFGLYKAATSVLRIGHITGGAPNVLTNAFLDFDNVGGSALYGNNYFGLNTPTFNIAGNTYVATGKFIKFNDGDPSIKNNKLILWGNDDNYAYSLGITGSTILYNSGGNLHSFWTGARAYNPCKISNEGVLCVGTGGQYNTHGTLRGLYVCDNFGPVSNGAEFRHSNGTQGVGIGYAGIYACGANATQSLTIKSKGNNSLYFETNDATRMTITGDGNVGIGTQSPAYKLHVEGDTYCTGYTRVASWGIYAQPNDAYLQPNDAHYGNWKMHGNAINTWNGIRFPISEMSLLCGTSTSNRECGFHNNTEPNGSWAFRIDHSKNAYIYGGLTITGYGTQVTASPISNKYYGYLNAGSYNAGLYHYGTHNDYISVSVTHSIKTNAQIYAENFFGYSDKRIKNNIVDIDDEKALSIFRQIKPKTYDYIDQLQRGNANVIGFIAQEIKEIIPKAVTIMKKHIPNFMTLCQVATIDASNIVLVTSPIDLSWNPLHDPSGNAFVDVNGNACSDASGNKVFNVKLYDQSNNEIECKTTNILDKRSFLMDVTGSKMVDASGNLVLETDGGYFLYGQEVDDFHNLDKAAIFTVVTAAVQDIDRIQQAQAGQIQAQQVQIQASQTQIQESQTQIQAQQVQIQDQANQVQDLKSKVATLEQQNLSFQSQTLSLQSEIMILQNQNASLQSQIQSQTASLQSETATLKQQIAAILAKLGL